LIAKPITTDLLAFADLKYLRIPPEAAIVDLIDFLGDAKSCSKFIAGELIYRDAVHPRRNLAPDAILSLADGLHLEPMLRGP